MNRRPDPDSGGRLRSRQVEQHNSPEARAFEASPARRSRVATDNTVKDNTATDDIEQQLAFDMVRRGLPVAPLLVLVAGLVWGADGVWSALLAVGLVLTNLVLSALALGWAARRSTGWLMATALGGFLARMVLVSAVLMVVRHEPWIELTALGVLVLVTHLGLLFWETRFVSASLAFPAMAPDGRPARGGTKLSPVPTQERHLA
ncbi:hypothetical protein BH18ACT4_BH18ACT4_10060 [soil metagenome]